MTDPTLTRIPRNASMPGHHRIPSLVFVALAAGVLALPLAAQTDDPPPTASDAAVELRALGIQRAAGPIRIDAQVDDEGWEGAARVTDFVEFIPREGAEPPVGTEVRMTYDDANLYVLFIASDPNPQEIRAAMQPRDRLWQDDWVGVLLDPFGDAATGYYFLANPIGVQGDCR
jgi:hypothetical protein